MFLALRFLKEMIVFMAILFTGFVIRNEQRGSHDSSVTGIHMSQGESLQIDSCVRNEYTLTR